MRHFLQRCTLLYDSVVLLFLVSLCYPANYLASAGYLHGFDKFMNLVLMNVDEDYTVMVRVPHNYTVMVHAPAEPQPADGRCFAFGEVVEVEQDCIITVKHVLKLGLILKLQAQGVQRNLLHTNLLCKPV